MSEIKLTHGPDQCCECVPHLESENARLRAELSKSEMGYRGTSSDRDFWKFNCEKIGKEFDELETTLEKLSCPICGSDVDGNNWKARAERLAKAARLLIEQTKLPENPIDDIAVLAMLKEALAAYETEGLK